MNRRARLLRLALGFVLVMTGAIELARTRPSERRLQLGDSCRTPARIIGPSTGAQGRVAVLFHGFSASAALMEPLGQALAAAGWRVYLLDLAGHGRSAQPFSYSNVETCAAAALEFLADSGNLRPGKTILVGHSLGAAVATRMADPFPVAATVAISPALLVLPRRIPVNLLILTGQFDFTEVKSTAKRMLAAAGGVRASASDFRERRAVALREVCGASHGGMILDPRVWKLAADWGARAVPPGTSRATQAGGADPLAKPLRALLSDFALLIGLALLIAPMETLVARACRLKAEMTEQPRLGWRPAVTLWIVASFFTVALLGLSRAAEWLRPVRMVDGDWAALAALIISVALLAIGKKRLGVALDVNRRAIALAVVAGIVTIAVFAFALDPELVEISASPPRVWRFAVLVALTWPYFWAEEAALGSPGGASRFFLFLVLRAIVWLAQLFALLVFWQWGLLLVLLVAQFAAVAIGQRLAADALRRRGAGAPAAALFDAILAAGMLALVLPFT